MRLTLVFCIAVALAGHAAAQTVPTDKAPPKHLADAARKAVAKHLMDPYSARFEGLRVYRTAKGAELVCGWVNSRNGFGAYGGRRVFYFDPDDGRAVIDTASGDVMDDLVHTVCHDMSL